MSLDNGVDSALTNERRNQRFNRKLTGKRIKSARAVEHDSQRNAEALAERQLGITPLVGDIDGPGRAHDIINAKTVAEHQRITGGGGVI